MSAPDWVTPDVMEKLRVLKDFGFQVKVIYGCVILDFWRQRHCTVMILFAVSFLQVMFGVYKQQDKSRLQGGMYVEL